LIYGGDTMKVFAAGLTLVLAFLAAGYAGAEHCTKDFWGNCQDNGRYENGRYENGRYHSRYRPCVSEYWGNCNDVRRRWRHYPRDHHVHQPRGERGELDRGVICHPRRRIVGDERSSREKAQQTAESAWRGAVRYDYGERYQNLDHAKDIRTNCDPSTVPSRGISKLLKAVQYRCVVEATPCRAPPGAEDKGVERRIEAESDDD
jgi:hypothetical protein